MEETEGNLREEGMRGNLVHNVGRDGHELALLDLPLAAHLLLQRRIRRRHLHRVTVRGGSPAATATATATPAATASERHGPGENVRR